MIQQSQAASTAAAEEVKTQRGSGKPTLPAPVISKSKTAKKGKQKDNTIGRGKESQFNIHTFTFIARLTILDTASLAQDDFLDIIRSGGIVSKA